MPTTRSRLQQGYPAASSASDEENDTLDPASLKQSTSIFTAPLTLPKRAAFLRTNSSSSQTLVTTPSRSFKRTCSSPAVYGTASDSQGGSGGIASRTRTRQRASSSSRKSSSSRATGRSQRSSIAGSQRGDDSSDNEEDRSQRSLRLGGCSQGSEALEARDDSNKENVAPLRHVVDMTEQQRMTEARDAQEEGVARRTRGSGAPAAAPMERRVSGPARATRNTARVGDATTPSSARRSLRSSNDDDPSASSMQTPSPARRSSQRGFPAALDAVVVDAPVSRKRARAARDEADDDDEARSNPASSLARLRLDDGLSHGEASLASPCVSNFGADDAESYFSSQCTTTSSIFTNGKSQVTSRCSTPASSRPATPLGHGKGSRIAAAVEERDNDLAALDDFDAATDAALPDDTVTEEEAAEQTFTNVYSHARALLRCNAGADGTDEGPNAASEVHIVGREKERKTLQRFLHSRFDLFQHMEHSAFPTGERSLLSDLDGAQDSGALYVCGMPGTGKTALLRSILAELREAHLALPAPRIAFVNCMTIEHPRAIFAKVLEALGEDTRGISVASSGTPAAAQADAEAERQLDAIVKDSSRRTLIVLDEIDHLLRSRAHQNIMYRLFSWAASSTPGKDGRGTCALVGIANSLDLTERFVPLLATKGAAPALLHFRPFEAAEIVSVVSARLTGLHEHYDGTQGDGMDVDGEAEPRLALFTPAALELAARKIAAATGDLRKALDAARLAVDLVETEQRKKALLASPGAEESGAVLAHFTPASAPKVTPVHILKILSAVLGSPQLAKVRNLGLQPKLVLLGLLVAQRRAQEQLAVLGSATAGGDKVRSVLGADGAVRLADVEMTYAAALKHDGGVFTALEASELLDVFSVLAVSGIIVISEDASATPSNTPLEGSASTSVSAGAKRAAKKQLLPANRMVRLAIASDEVLKGITTPPPASAAANGAPAVHASTLDAIKRIWAAEEERIRRSRTWQAQARESQNVRREELGGGRGAVGAF